MQHFWLDSDVFIQAKRMYYPFDVFPGFWQFLANQSSTQIIRSPYEVFRELTDSEDELSEWAKEHRYESIFHEPDESVQEYLRIIVDHVNDNFNEPNAKAFLDDADPWVIAHAIVSGGTVVTLEAPVGPDSLKVKIPNICKEYAVPYMNTFQMLRDLGAKFKLN